MKSLFAILCALAISTAAYNCLEQMRALNTLSMMHSGKKEAIAEGKKTLTQLLAKINSLSGSNLSARLSIASAVIRDFNAAGARVYSFNQAGIYNNHFNWHYVGHNAFLEKDENNHTYMNDLDLSHHNSAYVLAKVLLQGKIHQIATYVIKDPEIDLYYGCVVDLGKIMQSASFDKLSQSHSNLAVYVLYVLAIMALILLYYKARKRRLYNLR